MDFEDILRFVDESVYAKTGKRLKDVDILIIRGSWQGQNYQEIAEAHGYTDKYFKQDVGPRFWRLLSETFGERVSKTNFRATLERHYQSCFSNLKEATEPSFRQVVELRKQTDLSVSPKSPEFPEGILALDSPFYIERPPTESECYQEILRTGSLIRIKGTKRMGKTSLLNRILAYTQQYEYQVIRINLRQAEKSVFISLDKFLRWFCANASRQLNQKPSLENYWDEEVGSKVSCTSYIQMHLLEQANRNLVIGLDEIDVVFNYPDIAEDFLSLLREWHEEAKINEIWERLRLIVTHSTEVYIPLNIHQSPFNVGLPIKLSEFNQQQIQHLASLYRLSLSDEDINQLIAMVGGHPYLIQQALYYLWREKISLEQLLQTSPTEGGIYSDHLRSYLGYIQKRPELAQSFKQVITASSPVQLEPVLMYQLDSMGLVQLDGNQVKPSCELYRQYFTATLP
ncbi:MAG: AAA-like domain-containing protein [Mojavia pulchra JT2-VF2]|jgi:hypothetical protein|uniref:AAA-like domain-containing protein n=1 Tax=Mojavia pulchra JT2-VF2 TaxID=287848 RepID=A0A951UKN1_9NOST|nr:AAA-like domain-containing protein [Mojavia pulchra JT2-VF2]